MSRLDRTSSPKPSSSRQHAEPASAGDAEELSRIFAALSPDDRDVLLHVARKLADAV